MPCLLTIMIESEGIVSLKTLNKSINLAYSLDGYLWTISAPAAEKLQIRCVMETHVVAIKPPLQIVGNECKAYSASIYIPAKSELTAILQSITRSQSSLTIILTILM